jgi:GMP-PDE, delta subunit.
LIERHYFRDKLIKSYDFNFGFVIPNSTNTWDTVYETPSLSRQMINDIVKNPFQMKSDTFYFVDDKLIIHNKVSYEYYT